MKRIYVGASTLKKPTKDTQEHKMRQMHLQIMLQVSEQKMLPLTHRALVYKERCVFNLNLISSGQMASFCKASGITRPYIYIATSVK